MDELIQKAKTLDATATSAWMPRALTLGELVAREKLSELPGRRRTARLRELASQTRIGLKTVRQDLRICDTFFADEAKAANWLAREPVSREAFVTALVHPDAIEQAYNACVRGEYDRAAFRKYVKAQVADGAAAKPEQKGPTQRLRGLPPAVRAALDGLKESYPDLSESDLLQQLPKEIKIAEEKKKASRKSQRGRRAAPPPSQDEPVAETAAFLFAPGGQPPEGGRVVTNRAESPAMELVANFTGWSVSNLGKISANGEAAVEPLSAPASPASRRDFQRSVSLRRLK